MSINPNPKPKSKIRNPRSKTKIQNPKSKIQTAAFGAATRRTDTTTIQNPKSKIQNPKSKIRNPRSKIQNPSSKIQNLRSKIQTPKSKIQTAGLDFGVWIWGPGWGRRQWLCSKCSCMGGLATRIWPVSKRSKARFPRARLKSGSDFRRGGFAGNRASISSPVKLRARSRCSKR